MKIIRKLLSLMLIFTIILNLLINLVAYGYTINYARLYLLALGDADCILIQNDDKFILFDSGSKIISLKTKNCIKSIVGNNYLNYIVSTNNHDEHVGAMEDILNDDSLIKNDTKFIYNKYNGDMNKISTSNRINMSSQTSYQFDIENRERKKVIVNLFNNPTISDSSIISKININGKIILLTSDASIREINSVIQHEANINIMQLPRHGNVESITDSQFENMIQNVSECLFITNSTYNLTRPDYLRADENKVNKINEKYDNGCKCFVIGYSEYNIQTLKLAISFNLTSDPISYEKPTFTSDDKLEVKINNDYNTNSSTKKEKIYDSYYWDVRADTGKTYCYDPYGVKVLGFAYVSRKDDSGREIYNYYCFDTGTNSQDGYMLTGLQNVGNDYFYLDDVTGILRTGWIKIDNNWYYFKTDSYPYKGTMARNEIKKIGQGYFRFDSLGKLVEIIDPTSIELAENINLEYDKNQRVDLSNLRINIKAGDTILEEKDQDFGIYCNNSLISSKSLEFDSYGQKNIELRRIIYKYKINDSRPYIDDTTTLVLNVTLTIKEMTLKPFDVNIKYDKDNTNKKITVKINSEYEMNPINGWSLSNGNKQLEKEFYQNEFFELRITRTADGQSILKGIIIEFDQETEFLATLNYSTLSKTNTSVFVYIVSNHPMKKGVEIFKNGNWQNDNNWIYQQEYMFYKEFDENVEKFKIRVTSEKDQSQKELEIEINNIDKIAPVVTYEKIDPIYDGSPESTRETIIKVTSNEPIVEIAGWNLDETKTILTKSIYDDYTCTLSISDIAGNITICDITVIVNKEDISSNIEIKGDPIVNTIIDEDIINGITTITLEIDKSFDRNKDISRIISVKEVIDGVEQGPSIGVQLISAIDGFGGSDTEDVFIETLRWQIEARVNSDVEMFPAQNFSKDLNVHVVDSSNVDITIPIHIDYKLQKDKIVIDSLCLINRGNCDVEIYMKDYDGNDHEITGIIDVSKGANECNINLGDQSEFDSYTFQQYKRYPTVDDQCISKDCNRLYSATKVNEKQWILKQYACTNGYYRVNKSLKIIIDNKYQKIYNFQAVFSNYKQQIEHKQWPDYPDGPKLDGISAVANTRLSNFPSEPLNYGYYTGAPFNRDPVLDTGIIDYNGYITEIPGLTRTDWILGWFETYWYAVDYTDIFNNTNKVLYAYFYIYKNRNDEYHAYKDVDLIKLPISYRTTKTAYYGFSQYATMKRGWSDGISSTGSKYYYDYLGKAINGWLECMINDGDNVRNVRYYFKDYELQKNIDKIVIDGNKYTIDEDGVVTEYQEEEEDVILEVEYDTEVDHEQGIVRNTFRMKDNPKGYRIVDAIDLSTGSDTCTLNDQDLHSQDSVSSLNINDNYSISKNHNSARIIDNNDNTWTIVQYACKYGNYIIHKKIEFKAKNSNFDEETFIYEYDIVVNYPRPDDEDKRNENDNGDPIGDLNWMGNEQGYRNIGSKQNSYSNSAS